MLLIINSSMKYCHITKAQKSEGFSWQALVLMPIILGFTYGAGCYIAKVIIESPLVSPLIDHIVSLKLKAK